MVEYADATEREAIETRKELTTTEKAALVRRRRKVKRCMLSVLEELVTQGELRRVSFVEVNVQQLSALLLTWFLAFLALLAWHKGLPLRWPSWGN